MYTNNESEGFAVKLEDLNQLDEYTTFATSSCRIEIENSPTHYNCSVMQTRQSIEKPKEPNSWLKKYEHLNFNVVVTLEKIDEQLFPAANKRKQKSAIKGYANSNVESNSGTATIQDHTADPITCRKCYEIIANTENARWLHCLQHFTDEYDAKSYVCIFCALKYPSYRSIITHTRNEHYFYTVDYNFDADMKLHQLAFECFLTPFNKSICNNAIVIRRLKNGRPLVENTDAGPVLINLFQCLLCPGYKATRFRYLSEHFDFVHPHVRKLSHGVDYACHVQERPQQSVSHMEVSEELNIRSEQIHDNNTTANNKIPSEQSITTSGMDECVCNGRLTINRIFKPPKLSFEPPVLSAEVIRTEHSNTPSSQPSERVPVISKIVPSTMPSNPLETVSRETLSCQSVEVALFPASSSTVLKKLRITAPAKSSMHPQGKKTVNLVNNYLSSILTRTKLPGNGCYQRKDDEETGVTPANTVGAEITISSTNDSDIATGMIGTQMRETYKKQWKPRKCVLQTVPTIQCKNCQVEICDNANAKVLHCMQHLKVSQHIGVYSCLVCSTNDLTLQELCDHLSDEHKLTPVAYKTYKTKFQDCAAMVRFMMDQCFLLGTSVAKGTAILMGNESSWTSTKIQCVKCSVEIPPSTSSQLNHVYEHMQRETEFQWMYKCLICQHFETMEQVDWRKHMNAVHPDVMELIYGVHYIDNTLETVIPLRRMELECFQNKSQFSAPPTPPAKRGSTRKL